MTNILFSYIRSEARLHEQKALRKADQFRANSLMTRYFDLWAQQGRKESDTQTRSRLYSIFSAWKFYTKERNLLKRYLFECGETIGDVSQMSTIELRDAANKRRDESGSQLQGSISSYKMQSYGEAASKAAAINHLMSSNSQSAAGGRDTSLTLMSGTAALPNILRDDKRPSVAQTPSFMRASLPDATNRSRYVSPDVVLQAGNEKKRTEMWSAEEAHTRKKSNSVMSLLQRQFGGEKVEEVKGAVRQNNRYKY